MKMEQPSLPLKTYEARIVKEAKALLEKALKGKEQTMPFLDNENIINNYRKEWQQRLSQTDNPELTEKQILKELLDKALESIEMPFQEKQEIKSQVTTELKSDITRLKSEANNVIEIPLE